MFEFQLYVVWNFVLPKAALSSLAKSCLAKKIRMGRIFAKFRALPSFALGAGNPPRRGFTHDWKEISRLAGRG
jgi:hypothetical protein